MAERRPRRPARNQGTQCLLRPQPCAAGRRFEAGTRRALAGRPQRHGQDDVVQGDRRPDAGRQRLDTLHGRRARRPHARPTSRGSASAMSRRAGGFGLRSPSMSICSLPAAIRARNGRSRASTRHFRDWRNGATTAAISFPAASSRCSRSRARCLLNPRLLIMDEPTEGLAPVIVEQVEEILLDLGERRRHRRACRRAEHRRRDRCR